MTKLTSFTFSALVLALLLFGLGGATPVNAISSDCADMNTSYQYSGADLTGWGGAFAPGDFVTVTVTPIGNTTGTFKIISEGSGTIILAEPTSIPGTLTYLVTGPLPEGSEGIGFYIYDVSGDGTWAVQVSCSELTYTGPSIPNGFQLRSITCDVAVYNAPAGEPVGNNRIFAGQTWYVNPVAFDVNNEAWTEIFVGGTPNAWIPTRCVQQ
jgi:hypothetical protein